MLATTWAQLVAESLSATCGTVEQGVAAVGLSPTLLSVLCPGLHALLSATAGRSDELALLATRLAYVHGGEPVQGGCGGGLQACRQQLLDLPECVDSSSQLRSLTCCGAASAPVVCVVCETLLQQQSVAKTTSARSTRKGHDAGVLQ